MNLFKKKYLKVVSLLYFLLIFESCKEKIKTHQFYGTWIEIRKETDSGIVFLSNGKTLVPDKVIRVTKYDTLIVRDFRTNITRRRIGTIYDSSRREFYLDSIYKYTTNFKDTLRLTKRHNLFNVNITSIFLKVNDSSISSLKKRQVYYTKSDTDYVHKVIMNTDSSDLAQVDGPILPFEVMPVLRSRNPKYKVYFYGNDVYPVYGIEKNTKKEKDSAGYWIRINAKGKVNYLDYVLTYTTDKHGKSLRNILNNEISYTPGKLLGFRFVGYLFIIYKYDKPKSYKVP